MATDDHKQETINITKRLLIAYQSIKVADTDIKQSNAVRRLLQLLTYKEESTLSNIHFTVDKSEYESFSELLSILIAWLRTAKHVQLDVLKILSTLIITLPISSIKPKDVRLLITIIMKDLWLKVYEEVTAILAADVLFYVWLKVELQVLFSIEFRVPYHFNFFFFYI